MDIKKATSSRCVSMRDINALLLSAPISRIKTLRNDAGRRGFTLIELLVLVLIIGILAAIALPQYQKTIWKSRASEVKIFAKNLAEAQGMYRLLNGTYAQDFSKMDIKL